MTTQVTYHRKTPVYKEEQNADAFYVIKSGEFKVVKKLFNKEQLDKQNSFFQTIDIALLGKQQFFGQDELLKNIPRQSTICCSSEIGVLYKLYKQDFNRAFRGNCKIHDIFNKLYNTKNTGLTQRINLIQRSLEMSRSMSSDLPSEQIQNQRNVQRIKKLNHQNQNQQIPLHCQQILNGIKHNLQRPGFRFSNNEEFFTYFFNSLKKDEPFPYQPIKIKQAVRRKLILGKREKNKKSFNIGNEQTMAKTLLQNFFSSTSRQKSKESSNSYEKSKAKSLLPQKSLSSFAKNISSNKEDIQQPICFNPIYQNSYRHSTEKYKHSLNISNYKICKTEQVTQENEMIFNIKIGTSKISKVDTILTANQLPLKYQAEQIRKSIQQQQRNNRSEKYSKTVHQSVRNKIIKQCKLTKQIEEFM